MAKPHPTRPLTRRPEGRLPQIDLIATKALEGKVVHTELGVTFDRSQEIVFATRMLVNGLVDEIEYVSGEQVGLEWRTHDGMKLPQSDEWAKESYVVVTKPYGTEEIGNHGQPLTPRGQLKEKRRTSARVNAPIEEGDLDEWLEHLQECHEMWERIKSGRFY